MGEVEENMGLTTINPGYLFSLLIGDARPRDTQTLLKLCEKNGIYFPTDFRITWFDNHVLSLFMPKRFAPDSSISYHTVARELTTFFKAHDSDIIATGNDIFNYFRVFKGHTPGKEVAPQGRASLTEDSFPEIRGIYNAIMMYETKFQARESQFPHYKRDLQYIVASCYVMGMNGSEISRLLMGSRSQQIPRAVVDCMILDIAYSFPSKLNNVMITIANDLLSMYPKRTKVLREYLYNLEQGKYLVTPRGVHGSVYNHIKLAVSQAWLNLLGSPDRRFFQALKCPYVRVSLEGYLKGGPGGANTAFQAEFEKFGVAGERGSTIAKIALGQYFNGISVIDMIDFGYNFLRYDDPDYDHLVVVNTEDYNKQLKLTRSKS